MRLALVALATLALAGCETTEEKSAQLERVAKHSKHLAEASEPLRALVGAPPSSKVKVQGTSVVHTSEGAAAVVWVRNTTGTTLHRIPILIEVKDAAGASVYTNNQVGISPSLTSVPSLPAGGSLEWVDDQVQATGTPASVSATLGDGETGGGPASLPVKASVSEQSANGGTVEGTVTNPTGAAQSEVVVYATAHHGSELVAAGRAVVNEVPASGSSHFQLFLIGDPSGAALRYSASPTS